MVPTIDFPSQQTTTFPFAFVYALRPYCFIVLRRIPLLLVTHLYPTSHLMSDTLFVFRISCP